MIKLFSLSCLLLIMFYAVAQQNNYEEVVHLKNGSIIRGVIIEQIPNVQIKIQTKDRNVFVYKMEEIEKITKEPVYVESIEIKESKTINGYGKSSGFTVITEIGTIIYKYGTGAQPSFSIRTLLGGRASENVTVGFQFGLDLAGVDNLKNILFVPAGLGMRFSFMKARGTPFLDLGVGYVAGLEKYYYSYYGSTGSRLASHSFYFSPTIGGKVWANKKVAVSFKLGYQLFGFPSNGEVSIINAIPIMFGIEY